MTMLWKKLTPNIFWLYLIFLTVAMCQDVVFPIDEEEEMSHIRGSAPVTDRIPVLSPDKCPENMLLYPGPGSKSVWLCDCKPRYLYFPMNHTCHEAYRQGPCPLGEYVVLLPGDVVPKCSVNPCRRDGLVPYRGMCLRMRTGPCAPEAVLNVNEQTFQIECRKKFHIINAPDASCPPGESKDSQGICRQSL